jgi:hypothetical protein
MARRYVHGYDPRENTRLQDQASTLVQLLHCDTAYAADFDEGGRDLYRTTEPDGVFCYTFFKAVAIKNA